MTFKPKFIATVFLLLTFMLVGVGVFAQDKTLVWERYDVNVDVAPNSDIQIEEIQEINFTNGVFKFGFRSIPLDRVENITNIQVFERQGDRLLEYIPSSSQEAYTFETYQEDGEQVIYWYFPETQNSSHTYVIKYLVQGGLRLYEEGDQVWWKAIGGDHNFPIRSSQVKVTLPASFSPEQIKTESYGAPATSYSPNNQTVIFNATNIPPGQELEVRVQFPHGLVTGEVPAWQAEDDRLRAIQERYGPVLDLGFVFMGLMLLIGGPLGVYALWYFKGRDVSHSGLVADYLAEPPGNLSPGAAGTLIDEEADMEDILATLVDLARRGALHIEETQNKKAWGFGTETDFIFHLEDEAIASKPYEKKLIQKIFGSSNRKEMSDLKQKFYAVLPTLREQLYAETVQLGYFSSSPQSTRRKYVGLGVAGLILTFIFSFCVLFFTAQYSVMAICPILALVITSISLIITGRYMPQKTHLGAEEAAKWTAFKRYLQNIEKYGNLEEAKEKFNQYLPYAIAFGVDKSFIQKFAKIDTPAPVWYGPYFPHGHHRYPHTSSGAGGRTSPGPLAGEKGAPTLSDASRGMGTSLSAMSVGLGSMLSSASKTFTSAPSSSSSGSGGFSGGGFSGGGGGGGGSAGFG